MPMKKTWQISIASALAVVAVAVLTVMILEPFAGQSQDTRLRPDDAKALAMGERIYAAHCAACHGARLEGQPNWRTRDAAGLLPAPPHDVSGHTWHHPDETLFRITKYGVASLIGDPTYKTTMPSYEGRLRDEEIVAVLSWIKAQWPAAVRLKHDQINAQAAAKS